MAISLRAVGTASSATANVNSVNVSTPTGTVVGDLAVLIVAAKPYNTAITTPSGWTKIGEGTNGTVAQGQDVGSVKIAMYVRTDVGAGVATGNIGNTSGDTMSAMIVSYQKGAGESWDYSVFTTGSDTTVGANFSATGAAGLDLVTGDWVVVGAAINSDAGTPTAATIAATGATFTTNARQTVGVTTGWDSRGIIGDGAVTAGTSNVAPTLTYTNSSSTAGAVLFLRVRAFTAGNNYQVAGTVAVATAVTGSVDKATNVALLATATATSAQPGQEPSKAIDNVIDGYPGDSSKEWSSAGGGVGTSFDLNWSSPVRINAIRLFDRPNTDDRMTGATIYFSDLGATVNVGSLPNAGQPGLLVSFAERTVTWISLQVDSVSGTTGNVGLSEIQVFGVVVGSQYQVAGTVAVATGATGAVTLIPGSVQHQVAGTVAVTTGATGDATRVPIVHQVAGTVPVATAASGAVSANLKVAGTVPVVVGTAGTVSARLAVSGTVVIAVAANGDATVIAGAVTHQVAGTVAVVTGASGAISLRQPVAGTVAVVVGTTGAVSANLRVAGTVPVVTTAVGDATRVPLTLQVSGTVPVATAASGVVSLRAQVSGIAPVITGVIGDVTRVPVVHQVSGTVAVVTTAVGGVNLVGGAQQYPVSGTVAVTTGTSGAVTRVPVVHQVSGTVAVVTAASGDVTRVPVVHPVSGTVAVVTTASGSATIIGGAQQYQVSGTVAVVTGTSGDVTRVALVHQVSGTVPVATGATGAITQRLAVSGSVAVVTDVAGALTLRARVAGTVAVLTTVYGNVSVTGQVPTTNIYLGDIPVTAALGDVPVKLG
jgi:hypothetical protein